jgi:hypothetical protein
METIEKTTKTINEKKEENKVLATAEMKNYKAELFKDDEIYFKLYKSNKKAKWKETLKVPYDSINDLKEILSLIQSEFWREDEPRKNEYKNGEYKITVKYDKRPLYLTIEYNTQTKPKQKCNISINDISELRNIFNKIDFVGTVELKGGKLTILRNENIELRIFEDYANYKHSRLSFYKIVSGDWKFWQFLGYADLFDIWEIRETAERLIDWYPKTQDRLFYGKAIGYPNMAGAIFRYFAVGNHDDPVVYIIDNVNDKISTDPVRDFHGLSKFRDAINTEWHLKLYYSELKSLYPMLLQTEEIKKRGVENGR